MKDAVTQKNFTLIGTLEMNLPCTKVDSTNNERRNPNQNPCWSPRPREMQAESKTSRILARDKQ